jgi:septal ring factor EnvC (AmiA/AmiB activator)
VDIDVADAAIAELEAEVKATASMCDEVRAELNKVCVELEQAQAERDAARRVIVAAIAQMSKETRACAEEGSGDE